MRYRENANYSMLRITVVYGNFALRIKWKIVTKY